LFAKIVPRIEAISRFSPKIRLISSRSDRPNFGQNQGVI
jgi:hypothetical protein